MSAPIDREVLAERAAAVAAHLRRVADHLPADPGNLRAQDSATDTVILHLWQATQVVIDLAVSSCVRLGLGSPPTYGDAFGISLPPASSRASWRSAWPAQPGSATWSYTPTPALICTSSTPSPRPARQT